MAATVHAAMLTRAVLETKGSMNVYWRRCAIPRHGVGLRIADFFICQYIAFLFPSRILCARIPGSKLALSSAVQGIPSLAASSLLAGLRRSRTDLVIWI